MNESLAGLETKINKLWQEHLEENKLVLIMLDDEKFQNCLTNAHLTLDYQFEKNIIEVTGQFEDYTLSFSVEEAGNAVFASMESDEDTSGPYFRFEKGRNPAMYNFFEGFVALYRREILEAMN